MQCNCRFTKAAIKKRGKTPKTQSPVNNPLLIVKQATIVNAQIVNVPSSKNQIVRNFVGFQCVAADRIYTKARPVYIRFRGPGARARKVGGGDLLGEGLDLLPSFLSNQPEALEKRTKTIIGYDSAKSL